MTYLLTHLKTYQNTHIAPLKRIDVAPLAARYIAVIIGFNALRMAGAYKRLPAAARQIRAVLQAFIKAQTHNHHVEIKLAMLANLVWRARVLSELGGERKLELWIKALMRAKGALPKRRVPPKPEEPVWFRTPERIAESEALKQHARLCVRACVPQGTVRDPYRMDRAGQFRLAPLPRGGSSQPRKPVIYSALTIGDYNFNAVPIYKPQGFGPTAVSPLEFIAAAQIEAEDKNHPSVIPDKAESRRAGIQPLGTTHGVRSRFSATLVREDRLNAQEDFLPLPQFLGMEKYLSLFHKPP